MHVGETVTPGRLLARSLDGRAACSAASGVGAVAKTRCLTREGSSVFIALTAPANHLSSRQVAISTIPARHAIHWLF